MAEDEISDDSEITVLAPEPTEAEALKMALEEEKKKYLYLRADFDNFRRQSIKERSDLIKYGNEPVIRDMLSVLDDLERAAATDLTPDTIDKYKNGIELILTTFKRVLDRLGVEAIDSQGQPFDPNIHEALSSGADTSQAENTVLEVFRKPYKLHGKVIRPGQVVVNTAKQEG